MTRATSLFLDGLRLAAALVVFFAHTAHYWNPELLGSMQIWAHHAVIVFFVLSGYVIAHTTREGVRDARLYTASRLSRLYSVVAPALVLTVLLWLVGRELDPELYAHYERAHPAVRFVATSLFLNELWALEISPPTGTPFWSLGYEFWYYAFFGMALFIKPRGLKWLALMVTAAFTGPKILMLLPVWLVGVVAYNARDRGRFPRAVAWMGLVVSAGGIVLLLKFLPDWPETPGSHPWYFSGAALSDLIRGLGWGLVLWFFNRACGSAAVPDVVYRPTRWLAGHTFSLYLYHAPLVIFTTALFPPFMMGKAGTIILLSVILLVIGGLGALTEAQRPRWQRLFLWGWDRGFGRSL